MWKYHTSLLFTHLHFFLFTPCLFRPLHLNSLYCVCECGNSFKYAWRSSLTLIFLQNFTIYKSLCICTSLQFSIVKFYIFNTRISSHICTYDRLVSFCLLDKLDYYHVCLWISKIIFFKISKLVYVCVVLDVENMNCLIFQYVVTFQLVHEIHK